MGWESFWRGGSNRYDMPNAAPSLASGINPIPRNYSALGGFQEV